MKHIEQILPEYAAGDLSRLLVSDADATASAALTALLHGVTGCAIPPLATTPESEVEELVPLCLSILRRHWTTPLTALGDGTTPMSLADLMRRLIGDRVQGNEALGILPANDNIPDAVAALARRKITGLPELPDGLSFPRLLCDSTIPITTLLDDNIGWVMDKRIGDASTGFPFLPKKVVLNCKSVKYAPILVNGYNGSNNTLEELHFPMLEECGALFANSGVSGSWHPATLKLHTITMPKVKKLISYADSGGYYYQSLGLFSGGCPSLIKLELPNLEEMNIAMCGGNSLPNIQEIRMPKLKRMTVPFYSTYNAATSALNNLILLEIGEMETSINLNTWNPTDKGSLFLSNFRLYIADRLSDNGSGKTLTLSQEVRDAIHSAGIDTIITNKGWTISPVPTQQ